VGDWKAIESFEDDQAELYHLKEDLGETRDLARGVPQGAMGSETACRSRRYAEVPSTPLPFLLD
jgi:hypothetical protein